MPTLEAMLNTIRNRIYVDLDVKDGKYIEASEMVVKTSTEGQVVVTCTG